MVRRKIIAGNWKMNTTPMEGLKLVRKIVEQVKSVDKSVNFIVSPPFTHLAEVVKLTRGTGISVAAQNCASHPSGAYTGEVSAEMIASLGVEYVIIGHSERREYYGENSEVLNKKMEQALAKHLMPIYCIGEKLEAREAGKHFEVVEKQLKEVIFNLAKDQFAHTIIAYEPVWAIGTGKSATADQAQEIHKYVRGVLCDKFGEELANACTILYGGSMNAANAKELLSKPDVDGGLIGGASLKPEEFIAIAKSY